MQFIKYQLVKEGLVTTKAREKYMFVAKDMRNMQITTWMMADPRPRTEWMRILTTFALHLFAFSGCRIGAIFPDDHDKAKSSKGLRYSVSSEVKTICFKC